MIKRLMTTREKIESDVLSDIDDDDILGFVLESLKLETDKPYSTLLQVILHYEIAEDDAQRVWFDIVENRRHMAACLNRPVTIKTALVDYFTRTGRSEDIVIFVKENLMRALNDAMMDGLTGLYSHAIIHYELEKEFLLSQRYGFDVCVLFIDIDNFKRYNDEHGHKNGDRLLITVSDQLVETVRKTDKIGRYGGEEFLVVLPHTKLAAGVSLANKIVRMIAKKTATSNRLPEGVTVSIGVAGLSPSIMDGHDLIKAADMAMYRAKRAGKNRVAVADGIE
ncbi:MAG TPA: GGDEF domain-containing protein [Spirochaetota bacterium]|nr:GGDEF domain-containing protein [Spirochaetota bacterium]HNT13035.1 GGDEF domain-containing protein [Spirochaetota bacterium]